MKPDAAKIHADNNGRFFFQFMARVVPMPDALHFLFMHLQKLVPCGCESTRANLQGMHATYVVAKYWLDTCSIIFALLGCRGLCFCTVAMSKAQAELAAPYLFLLLKLRAHNITDVEKLGCLYVLRGVTRHCAE